MLRVLRLLGSRGLGFRRLGASSIQTWDVGEKLISFVGGWWTLCLKVGD